MPAGDFFHVQASQALFNLVSPSLPANLFIAAFTDSVTFNGTGTEVGFEGGDGGVGYARPQIAGTGSLNGAFLQANQFVLLNTPVEFPIATGNWGTIISMAIVTSATGSVTGANVAFGDLDNATPAVINTDDTLITASFIGFFFTFNVT